MIGTNYSQAFIAGFDIFTLIHINTNVNVAITF